MFPAYWHSIYFIQCLELTPSLLYILQTVRRPKGAEQRKHLFTSSVRISHSLARCAQAAFCIYPLCQQQELCPCYMASLKLYRSRDLRQFTTADPNWGVKVNAASCTENIVNTQSSQAWKIKWAVVVGQKSYRAPGKKNDMIIDPS